MKPLSVFNYYKNNKKKVIPVIVSITIGVFLLYFLYIFGDSVISTVGYSYINSYKHFTTLHPNEEGGIDQQVLDSIRGCEDVEKTLKIMTAHTNIYYMARTSTMVIYMDGQELNAVFDRMKLKLKSGVMPSKKDEILMHWRIAANKGYKVGDVIGSDVSEKEELSGKYTVAGIFDGESQLSFVPVSVEESELYGSYMILPKSGRLTAMNAYLHKLPYEKIRFNSLVNAEQQFEDNMSIVYTGSIFIELLVVLVLCITIGNTTYLHFYQRKKEFGILMAVGYSRRELMYRAFMELYLEALIAFVSGVILAIITGSILKLVYMDPIGATMRVLSIKYALFAAILPVTVMIFSLLPSAKMLMGVDRIKTIEE